MTRTDDTSPSPMATDTPGEGQVTLPAAVLWDMDGTLVDTEPYWFAAERDVVDRYGHGHWPDEHAHAMVGFDLLDSAAFMREHGGVDLPGEEIVERLLDGVIARLHRRIPWQPGARELLADLNEAGIPCALVTMSWRRLADPVLAALPAESFVASVTGDEVPAGHGKPHPDPYLLGAEACGAAPGDCIAIEDSPTGVRSAVAAGCHVIGVPNVKELDRESGVTIIESLDGATLRDLCDVISTTTAVYRASGWSASGVAAELSEIVRRPVVLAALALVVAALVWFAVQGDDEPELVMPPGAIPIDVWAPYWTLGDTLPEAEARLADVREVSPFWYAARGVQRVVVNDNASDEQAARFLDVASSSRARMVPSIQDEMPAGGMAGVLADPTSRSRHVDTIVAFADDLDADGIDLDYEQFAFADGRDTWASTRPKWVAFVTELAAALHADGRTLTVSIPPVWGLPDDADTDTSVDSASGYWVYDHGAIAPFVDAIRIMAYDYSVNEPGPIAPTWWVADLIASTSAVVPEEFHDKLVLGVGSYGRNWVVGTQGECPATAEGLTSVFARSVTELAEQRGGVPTYDAATGEWSFGYSLTVENATTTCVQNRMVRWVDAEGVAERTELARRAGWGGVSLWALGYEDDEVWQSVISASRNPLPSQPAD